LPYTTLVSGTTVLSSWANANVRDQVVTPFASAAARDSAITAPVEGMLCYTSDTDVFWWYNGSKWMRKAKRLYVGSLQTYTTTTMADVPNLTFTGDAGGVYAFTGFFHTVAPTANDLSVQWTIPAGASIEWGMLGPASTDAGTEPTTVYMGAITTSGPLTVGGMASNGVVTQPIGTITIGGTSGTCKIQAAQGSAGGSSFIRAPSWLEVEQIG